MAINWFFFTTLIPPCNIIRTDDFKRLLWYRFIVTEAPQTNEFLNSAKSTGILHRLLRAPVLPSSNETEIPHEGMQSIVKMNSVETNKASQSALMTGFCDNMELTVFMNI